MASNKRSCFRKEPKTAEAGGFVVFWAHAPEVQAAPATFGIFFGRAIWPHLCAGRRGGAPNYFDDANVSAVKALPQMGQDAYVLLYTRGDEVPVKCPRRLLAQAFIECATR